MRKPSVVGALTALGLWLLVINTFGITGDAGGIGMIVAIVLGGAIGTVLQRGLRGGSSGFWQTTWGRWLIGRMAGTAVYAGLTLVLWAPPVALIQPRVASLSPVAWVILGLAGLMAWFLRTPAKVFIGKASAPLRRFYRSLRMGGGGSSTFAGIYEEWAHRWRPGMIFFGDSLFDRHWPVGIKDERMLLTLAGTGAGKGESSIINNVLLHDGSMFINDPSGQIAAVTAEALKAKGFEVRVIDQMDVLGQGTSRIDPIGELDPEARDYVSRLKQLVDAMSISTGSGRNRFFEEAGKTICAGAIDFAIRRQGEEFVPPEEIEFAPEREEEIYE